MITYFIQVSLCWLVFYLIYILFLRKETFFHINRWYLLLTLSLGMILPLIRFLPVVLAPTPEIAQVYIAPIATGIDLIQVGVQQAHTSAFATWGSYLLVTYTLGVILLTSRFIYGLFQIFRLYRRAEKTTVKGTQLARTDTDHLPFSFGNTIFWSKNTPIPAADFEQIVQHEQGHIQGWHTADVLLVELISILAWCSPPIWLYRKSIKEVHEYLADAYVLHDTETKHYGRLLLRQAQPHLQVALANHFFHSHLKNRIAMMTKSKSQQWKRWKYTIGISVFALLFMAFSYSSKTFQDLLQKTGKTSFGWSISSLKNGVFDIEKIKQILNQELHEAPIVYNSETGEVITGDGNKSIQITNFHEAYRDLIRIFPEHQAEIEEVAYQVADKYHLNAEFDEFTIKYQESNDKNHTSTRDNQETPEPLMLVFIDGIEQASNECLNLGTHKVKDMVHLTLEESIEKYGDRGKNKVIEVTAVPRYDEAPLQEVDEMPRFPGCETLAMEERTACAQQKLLQFIFENLKYPKASQKNEVEGIVLVQFVVDKNGKITNPTIARSLDGPTSDEVLRIMRLMPDWIPGKQDGKTVHVEMKLPIKFKLSPKAATTTTKQEEEKEAPYKVVEEMPRFPGCEELPMEEREACAQQKLLEFVYQNIKYPKTSRENDIQGMVVTRFVVEKDGRISNPEIIRSLDEPTNNEVLRIVDEMPLWIPGKQDGKAVAVKFHLPVKFKLDSSAPNPKEKTGDDTSTTLELQNFSLSPNPAQAELLIRFDAVNGTVNMKISDSSGKMYAQKTQSVQISEGIVEQKIDLDGCPTGMLFLTIEHEGKVLTKSFLKN